MHGVLGVWVSTREKSKAPVLADCTFYYSPIKQQALHGMQTLGREKVQKKNEKENSPPMLKQLFKRRHTSHRKTQSVCHLRLETFSHNMGLTGLLFPS